MSGCKSQQEAVSILNPTAPAANTSSPALGRREREKREKYSRLLMLAKRQTAKGKRADRPDFKPMVFSTNGDVAPGAEALLEWIAGKYCALMAASPPRLDGCAPKTLTRAFRRESRHTIMCHLAAGQGEMIAWAGAPNLRGCVLL